MKLPFLTGALRRSFLMQERRIIMGATLTALGAVAKTAYDTVKAAKKKATATSTTPAAGSSGYVDKSTDTKPAWLTYAEGIDPGSSSGMSYGTTKGNTYADDYLSSVQKALKNYQSNQNSAILDSIKSAYDQNKSNLTSQVSTIQQDAADLKNQNDTTFYTQSLPGLYSAMESGGQRGGENITGRVALETARQSGQNDINLYEKNQLANIQTALSNLDSQQTQAIASAQQNVNSDVLNQNLSAIQNALSNYQSQQSTERADLLNSIGAYSNDYQAQINKLTNDSDTSNDWLIPYLQAARNEKIANQQSSASDAAQQAEENALAWAKLYASDSQSSTGGTTLTYSQALTLYMNGSRDASVLKALGMQ